jgi:hypothetical protein
MPEELLAIGRFARLCRLGVKQLRHYDEVGLLPPARIDAFTGYRYYSRHQVRDAVAIALLRSLDVPLPTIAQVLAGDEAARDVPPLTFLAIDGTGDPDRATYREAVESLYGVAYAVRFALKRDGIVAYPVMPLQGLWRGSANDYLITQDRDAWSWTMMIMQPPQVTPDLVTQAAVTTTSKRPSPAVKRIGLRDFEEGPSAQVLHVGPYREETATIARLMAYIGERGHEVSGTHHEIYLSNPSRTPPKRLKTIIRYPVRPRLSDRSTL